MNLDSYTCTCFPKPRPAIDWDAHLKRQAELRDEICTLKAALSSAPQGWRPIETAPKDGTHWQLWDVDDECATRGYWRTDTRYEAGGFWQDYYKANCVVRASHYMPLPAAPKSPADGGV